MPLATPDVRDAGRAEHLLLPAQHRVEDLSFKALGKMGSLGHRSAVAEAFGMKLSGFLAWWLWRSVYLMKLPGLDRKIRVAMDWTLDLILPPDIVQLRTDTALAIGRGPTR